MVVNRFHRRKAVVVDIAVAWVKYGLRLRGSPDIWKGYFYNNFGIQLLFCNLQDRNRIVRLAKGCYLYVLPEILHVVLLPGPVHVFV